MKHRREYIAQGGKILTPREFAREIKRIRYGDDVA